MGHLASPYYPPRARWYSPALNALDWISRRMALNRLHPPPGVPALHLLASLAVPGLGFWFRSRSFWGPLLTAASLALGLSFFIWLGRPPGNIAFGLLLSLHASALTYLIEPWLRGTSFSGRALYTGGILIALLCLLYLPARAYVQRHWFAPLTVKGQVMIFQKWSPPSALRRGDVIAYTVSENYENGVYIQRGFGVGEVLAGPGDQVRFGPALFHVNATPRLRLDHMPANGECTVREKQWFVWPELVIGGHGNAVSESQISALMLEMGLISENRYAGRACKRWFWRQQQ